MTFALLRGFDVAGRLYVGTSGFAYKEWKGVFYPEGVSDKQMLAHYSKILSSVEINYTFRRMPSESALTVWRDQAGEGFTFTLKAPQRITHIKRLKEVQEDVDEFIRRGRILGNKLGSILFQLPPSMKYERERLEKFLGGLPPVCRYALEFRHESWAGQEVRELLAQHEVALCGAETDDKSLESLPSTATGYSYIRLRKEDYPDAEIAAWAARIRPELEAGRDVFSYFKHEVGGAGPAYAQKLKDLLE